MERRVAVGAGAAVVAAVGVLSVAARRRLREMRAADDELDATGAPHPFDSLKGYSYANLTTFRKSGEEVSTPVWFALYDGRLYVTTPPDSGKMKRIRNNPRVFLTPSDFRGTPKRGAGGVEGVGRIVADEPNPAAEDVLARKYRVGMTLFRLFGRESIGEVTLEVSPAEPTGV